MAKAPRTKAPRPISIALQGGGAHGAFTWGVLDRLCECEEIEIKAITATSAGAMNAVAYSAGMHEGGREGARRLLHDFWKEISRRGAPLDALAPQGLAASLQSMNPFSAWTPASFATALSAFLSPYELNPFDLNPLRDTVCEMVDFKSVLASDIALHIAATNVETGRVKVFTGDDVTPDAVLASACLPQTFKAVEIDGVPYWDGGYMGNPSLFPLIYSDAPRDILLVLLNPLDRAGTPRTAAAIQDRLNEISFNSALIGEMRAIAFVGDLLDENWLARQARSRFKKLYIHLINGGDDLCDMHFETKFDTSWQFLEKLKDLGRAHAETWLQSDFAMVGKESSVNIHEVFLGQPAKGSNALTDE